jgi:integral membrane protein (TIGR01906 family)
MRWVFGYLAAACVLALLVCEAFIIPTFMTGFYSYEFDKNGTPAQISVEKPELMRVTGEMLNYMRGQRDDLDVPATVNGQQREFFNQREKDHMVDVRVLFDRLFLVRNVAFWTLLFLIICMALFKYNVLFVLARCAREAVAGFCLLAILLAGIIAFNFERSFEVFHLIFFDNDLWILNPATDLLVNIVPQPFFLDIAIFIGALFVLASLLLILVTSLYIRRASSNPLFTGRR